MGTNKTRNSAVGGTNKTRGSWDDFNDSPTFDQDSTFDSDNTFGDPTSAGGNNPGTNKTRN